MTNQEEKHSSESSLTQKGLDTIYRQEAIDALDCINGVEEVLRSLPSAQPKPQWIPCSERLPEESGEYLVSGKWESGKVAVGDCEYLAEDGYFSTAWNFDVLAWMPLPECYKGES